MGIKFIYLVLSFNHVIVPKSIAHDCHMIACDGHACKSLGNSVGRPPIDIDLDKVEYLRSSLLL